MMRLVFTGHRVHLCWLFTATYHPEDKQRRSKHCTGVIGMAWRGYGYGHNTMGQGGAGNEPTYLGTCIQSIGDIASVWNLHVLTCEIVMWVYLWLVPRMLSV